MHTGTISPTGLRVALATGALLFAGAMVGAAPSSADQSATSAALPEIACGGYSADGQLLRPAATDITHARFDDGKLTVPSTCGGYTEDGEFIGDD